MSNTNSKLMTSQRVLTQEQVDEMRRHADRATDEIIAICSGARRWTMSIPVADTDSDRCIIQAVNDLRLALNEIQRIRGVMKAMIVSNLSGEELSTETMEALLFWGVDGEGNA